MSTSPMVLRIELHVQVSGNIVWHYKGEHTYAVCPQCPNCIHVHNSAVDMHMSYVMYRHNSAVDMLTPFWRSIEQAYRG